MPYDTARRRHRWLTTVAAAMRLVTPQLATESGLASCGCASVPLGHRLAGPGQFHSRAVLSRLAVASSRPSGLNATA